MVINGPKWFPHPRPRRQQKLPAKRQKNMFDGFYNIYETKLKKEYPYQGCGFRGRVKCNKLENVTKIQKEKGKRHGKQMVTIWSVFKKWGRGDPKLVF